MNRRATNAAWMAALVLTVPLVGCSARVVHTGHAVEEADPELVRNAILAVVKAARWARPRTRYPNQPPWEKS